MFVQFTGCTGKFRVSIGQKTQLTGWENVNNMRNAKCASTQNSMEWLYCSFLYCEGVVHNYPDCAHFLLVGRRSKRLCRRLVIHTFRNWFLIRSINIQKIEFARPNVGVAWGFPTVSFQIISYIDYANWLNTKIIRISCFTNRLECNLYAEAICTINFFWNRFFYSLWIRIYEYCPPPPQVSIFRSPCLYEYYIFEYVYDVSVMWTIVSFPIHFHIRYLP